MGQLDDGDFLLWNVVDKLGKSVEQPGQELDHNPVETSRNHHMMRAAVCDGGTPGQNQKCHVCIGKQGRKSCMPLQMDSKSECLAIEDTPAGLKIPKQNMQIKGS